MVMDGDLSNFSLLISAHIYIHISTMKCVTEDLQ